MTIENQRLVTGDEIYRESPNHSGLFGERLPDTIVIHYTAGASFQSSVESLCDPSSKASAHLVIGRDGEVAQLVPFDRIAWHAGKSSYGGRSGLNQYSIGIEIDNAGCLKRAGTKYKSWFGKNYEEEDMVEAVHRNETVPSFWHCYTQKQIETVQQICTLLADHYGDQISAILGHEEISPGRKRDPGPAFPLETIRERGLIRDRGEDGPAESVPPLGRGMVDTAKLNIRHAPDIDAETVAPPLSGGTIVDILGMSGNWYHVDVGIQGWVSKTYIKTFET